MLAVIHVSDFFHFYIFSNTSNNKTVIIIIRLFIKHKILSLETIVSSSKVYPRDIHIYIYICAPYKLKKERKEKGNKYENRTVSSFACMQN